MVRLQLAADEFHHFAEPQQVFAQGHLARVGQIEHKI